MAKVMFVEVNIRRTALQYFWSVGPVTGFVATSAGVLCRVKSPTCTSSCIQTNSVSR